MTAEPWDAVVVGGGAYGCILAVHLRRRGRERVLLIERESELLRRASWANQARVHNGYHYPRSVLTALRSRVNYPRFVRDYRECIHDSFTSLYAVARSFSNVTAAQFQVFCERIGAPVRRAGAAHRSLFDDGLVEDVFEVEECVFDAARLAARLRRELEEAGVEVVLGAEVLAARRSGEGLELSCRGALEAARAPLVLNCTYSRLNKLLVDSGCPPLPVKHELTELALVDVPQELSAAGVTVMCGPFFSLMPFPATGRHTLSHVRYTPHCEWRDEPGTLFRDPYAVLEASDRRTAFAHMLQDARRFLPAIAGCVQTGSLFEVKTVLVESEVDDSRPILMQRCEELPGLVTVMGSKIDNVYDAAESLQ